jgi:steroid delta-isomerase
MEHSVMVAMVHKYVEAFEKQDMDIIREIYAADARVEDPVGTEVRQGIEAICEFYQNGFSGGAKLALTGEPRCAGSAVAFPFQVKIPGMVIDIIDVFEFNDAGKVNSMKAYWSDGNMKADD